MQVLHATDWDDRAISVCVSAGLPSTLVVPRLSAQRLLHLEKPGLRAGTTQRLLLAYALKHTGVYPIF